MRKLTPVEKERIRGEIDDAFEAVKLLVEHPEKVEATPDQAVLLPIRLRAQRESRR